MDENPVQARVRIQPCQEREQFGFARGFGQNVGLRKNSQLGAGFFFPAHIDLRGGVFTDPHERQPRLQAARFENSDPLGQFGLQLLGDGPSVDKILGRH